MFLLTEEACQEKWRILRGSFSRSYKHKMEGNTNRKEYYLSKHMQFLVPYMKTSKKPKVTQTPSQEVEVLPDQYMTFKFEDTEDYQSDTTSQVDTSTIFEESTGDITKDSFEQVSVENDSKKRKRCSNSRTEESDDSDLLFLKSILPEMKALEGKKKNIFKIKVLNTLAELLYASSEDITTASSSTGEAFKNCTDSGLIYTKL